MLLYPLFFRKHGIRRRTQLVSPPLSSINNFVMPKESVLHYLGDGPSDFGITADDPMLNEVDKIVMVDHVIELRADKGPPKPRLAPAQAMRKEYHRKNRKMRPLRKMETALRDPRTLIVINYALLPHLYRYITNFFIEYNRWYNISATRWDKMNEMATKTNRQQFIKMTLPQLLPSMAQLRKGERNINRQVLDVFKENSSLDLLDLWIWLGEDRQRSLMSKLEAQNLDKINLIWVETGRFFVLNLGVLEQWRRQGEGDAEVKEDDGMLSPEQLQKHFLKMLMSLFETRTAGAGESTLDDFDDDSKVIEGKLEHGHDKDTEQDILTHEADDVKEEAMSESDIDDDVEDLDLVVETLNKRTQEAVEAVEYTPPQDNLESGITSVADEMVDVGLLSAAEYRRVNKLSERYKEIENPFGKGTLEEFIKINPEELKLTETNPILENLDGVLDKSMLNNTTDIMDKKYIKEFYHRDIANAVMGVQKVGVAVQNYKVERVDDHLNSYEIHTVKLVPVVGSPSTVRFRVPVINEDGTFLANGIKQQLRKQRGDMPIRKISSSEVALSSYYGKLFVTRSDRAVHNYEKWLINHISSKGLDNEDQSVTDLKFSNVFISDIALPHVYSILSKNFVSFLSDQYFFYFNFNRRVEKFGEDRVTKAEYKSSSTNHNLIVCGTKGKNVTLLMDPIGNIYGYQEGGELTEEGTIESIVGLPMDKRPVEIVEVGIFGKPVPLGFILAYEVGLNNLIRLLKLEPRRVPRGTRIEINDDEFPVRFEDETLVFDKNDKLGEFIFGGFNRFHKDIKRYSLYSFDKKDIYQVILERNGLGARYVRELDMIYKMFVDAITKDILIQINEPTDMVGLFLRAAELLRTDDHPNYSDMRFLRDKGYERISGMIYGELARAVRTYKSKPASAGSSVDVNPQAIWMSILDDPAGKIIEESNPISNLKQKEEIIFSGTGGRTSRSMTAKHRQFDKTNLGNTSEATKDSGDAGTVLYLTADPKYVSVRGITKEYNGGVDGPSRLGSPSMMVSPASDRDD